MLREFSITWHEIHVGVYNMIFLCCLTLNSSKFENYLKNKFLIKQSGSYLTESANIYLPDHYDRGKRAN